MEYIPALSLLVAFLVIIIALQQKLTADQLAAIFDGKNFLLFSTVALFCIMLVVHLFKEQSWTADVLKVIVGVLVGAGAAYSKGDDKAKGQGATQTAIGSAIQQAMGDIIGEMKGDIGQLKDSVVNQYQTIEQRLSTLEEQEKRVGPVITRTERFQVQSEDPEFIAELRQIQREGGNWTDHWIDKCLNSPDFQAEIFEKIASLSKEGWRAVGMGLDNHNNGLHINLDVEKNYEPQPNNSFQRRPRSEF
jgi:hypothetical protein